MPSIEELRVKECPSCNASVPDSADVCPSCSLEFGDDEGDARKTMLGMSFGTDRNESGDASSTADGTPGQETGQQSSDDEGSDNEDAEELLFNLDFRRPRDDDSDSDAGEPNEDNKSLRVPDDASPTGTLRGTGSEVTDAEDEPESGGQGDLSANPATRTHDGLPEFKPGRVFGGSRSSEDGPRGKGEKGADGETEKEQSRRVDAEDLESVRQAFRRGDDETRRAGESIEEALSESAQDLDENGGTHPSEPEESDDQQGPRAEDFSETPGSGIFKVPKKKEKKEQQGEPARKDTEPGYASEQSGSGIIKRAPSTTTDESTEQTDVQEDESDLMGDNAYVGPEEAEAEAVSEEAAVRQTAQVADLQGVIDGWNSADETAQISPEEQEEPEPQRQASLAGETDVISEGTDRGTASWVALVAGVFWVIAADTIWMTAAFETVAVKSKFATAMIGGIWGLFGPFLVEGRRRAYGHVIVGSVAGSAFAATLAATGLALGDIAGLLGAVVLIVAGVLED